MLRVRLHRNPVSHKTKQKSEGAGEKLQARIFLRRDSRAFTRFSQSGGNHSYICSLAWGVLSCHSLRTLLWWISVVVVWDRVTLCSWLELCSHRNLEHLTIEELNAQVLGQAWSQRLRKTVKCKYHFSLCSYGNWGSKWSHLPNDTRYLCGYLQKSVFPTGSFSC